MAGAALTAGRRLQGDRGHHRGEAHHRVEGLHRGAGLHRGTPDDVHHQGVGIPRTDVAGVVVVVVVLVADVAATAGHAPDAAERQPPQAFTPQVKVRWNSKAAAQQERSRTINSWSLAAFDLLLRCPAALHKFI